MRARRRSYLDESVGEAGEQSFWPSFADLTSTIALILFVLVLLAYIQNLFGAKQLQRARAELDALPPHLLVSEIRLGGFNGLHLAIRCASRDLRTAVILLGDADPILQGEAERQHARFLTLPLDEAAFLATVREVEQEHRPSRRSPR